MNKNPDRPELDTYFTPPSALTSLLENVKFSKNIWEPAAGNGALVNELLKNKHNVYASDIFDYGSNYDKIDFISDHKIVYDNIITNPPFNVAERFIEKAKVSTKEKFAFLLRLNFLEGQKRKKIWGQVPPP